MTPYTTSQTVEEDVILRASHESGGEALQAFTLGVVYDAHPPQTFEAVERFADLLRIDAALEGGMGGPGRIYTHVSPGAKPDRYLVVREPIMPGGQPEHFTRVTNMRIQVLAECAESLPNRAWWLSAIHARVYSVMTGVTLPGLEKGNQLLRVKRTYRPSAPAYDADDHAFYSSAEYALVLGPTGPQS